MPTDRENTGDRVWFVDLMMPESHAPDSAVSENQSAFLAALDRIRTPRPSREPEVRCPTGVVDGRIRCHSRRTAQRERYPFGQTMKTLHVVLGALLLASFTACGKKSDHAGTTGGHAHTAPHGGTLVELGDHAYNIELVRDLAAGKLTAYVLDGHAEKFVRINAPKIDLIAMPGGKYTPLVLQAVANPATGETAGDTSQFQVQADWLKTPGGFAGIFTVEIKGTKFEQVSYQLDP